MKKTRKREQSTRASPPANVEVTSKTKLIVFAWIVGLLGSTVWMVHAMGTTNQSRALTKNLEKWKFKYHLSPEQATRIVQIELDFHGTGSPFQFPAPKTVAEKDEHDHFVSQQMSAADGAQFLKDINATVK